MKTEKTVFFDLGNVLLFFSHQKMWQQLAELTKINPDLLRDQFLKRGAFNDYESGRINTEQVYRMLQSLSPRSFSLLEAMQAASDIFTPNKELWRLVEELKERSTRLVLLSNTNESHFNFAYSHYPILKLFDEFILSFQVGACKPEPAIFQRALREARGTAFYTDDISAYVKAARAEGLDAEIYTTTPLLIKQLEERGFF